MLAGLGTALGLLGYRGTVHGNLKKAVQATVERIPGDAERCGRYGVAR